MNKMKSFTILFGLIVFLTACAGNSSSGGEQADYDKTKKMVVDILKTDDGKKAITEVLSDKEMKQQVVLESDLVKTSIEETVTSDKGKKFWEELFKNPQFSKTFAQSLSDEQKKIMKALMNDSQFQKSMLELLQNPEMESQMLSVMKSQQFREHLEETIQQTMDTPMFKEKMSSIVLKAAEEMKSGQSESDGGGSQGEKGSGSGSGQDQQSSEGSGSE